MCQSRKATIFSRVGFRIIAQTVQRGYAICCWPTSGKEGEPEPVIAKISQDLLPEMVGTTRSHVSFFMNKFRKLGFIEDNEGLHVHSSLLKVVLHD